MFANGEFEGTLAYYRLESSQIELDCASSGQPKPQVLWYKNENIVSEEDLGLVR